MRKSVGLLASVFALGAVGTTPTAPANVPVEQTQKKDIKGINAFEAPANSIHNFRVEPFVFNELGSSVPPKMWGQYLQRTGRQKWTKKRRK